MKSMLYKCGKCGKITTTTNPLVFDNKICKNCRLGKQGEPNAIVAE